MFGELVNGVKMAFTGIRYPQLISFVEDVMNFALWFQEVFRFDKADFDEIKEYIQRKFEELEQRGDEISDEEIQKALGDVVLKVMKKAGKYVKASKYDEEKNVLKVVLQDKEKRKLVLVITAKVVE
ncbi:hypothetical protein [Thermococcus barophilus]|uniref:Uncharacterized protein n=1 Tax=Thermococcus barophilus TaxID=55802 RepID=A0A0S1XF90_THEBA|nr:hypothetical protein [Thermococcus barophilus]ALM76477.1 hypothetical protein TBCH5v1_2588 [Thermococcus barophilus]